MATDITVPAVGESIAQGTVSRWIKKDGDLVRLAEPVMELETEKATSEVPAPVAGRLRILAPEGATVAIGTVVGRIEEAAVPDTPPPRSETKRELAPETNPAPAEPKASPAARHWIAQGGIDAAAVVPTGPDGRITKEDVVNHLAQAEPAPTAAPAAAREQARESRQRMTGIRQRIAERLLQAQASAAILTTFNEVDMSAVMELRAKYKDKFKEKHGVGLGFMAFFVKATVEALRAFPVVHAWIEGQDIVHHADPHIGVAVSTEKGLMVPVLKHADRLSFAEIERQIATLANKARDGKIAVDDLTGGTFTITNGGIFGSLLSTPILNAPQSAILGMHAIQKRPIAVNDAVVIRPMMYLALSYDHRLIDGREAVQFLVRVKDCIEDPQRLLLEV